MKSVFKYNLQLLLFALSLVWREGKKVDEKMYS